LPSVSALEDVGYCVLFKREHVFIYTQGVDPVELQLIGNRVNRLYMLRGQPLMYDSTLDEELSTGKRLSQVDRTDAQDEVSSRFLRGFQEKIF
jgi:hypothetical protein